MSVRPICRATVRAGITPVTRAGVSSGITSDGVKRSNTFSAATSGIQTISRSSVLSSSYEGWMAFNGQNVDGSGNAWISGTTLPQWLKIDFGQPQLICLIKASSFIGTTAQVTDFTIDSSDDDSAWTTRRTVAGYAWDGSQTLRTFTLDSPAEARYWRINCTASAGTRAGFVEVEFYS